MRAARTDRGWTKTQLIRALRQAAAREGTTLVGHASLSRAVAGWENGHHFPTQYVDLLSTVYDRPPHLLGLAPSPQTPCPGTPEPDYPQDTGDAVDHVTSLWRADLTDPATAPRVDLVPQACRLASLAWLVAPGREPLPAPRKPVRVHDHDVHAVKETVDLFARMDNTFGGGHARRSLIQYLEHDAADLLASQYTDPVGRALFSAVAEGTLLAAWMSYDSAHHGLAQRYFVQALRLAHIAEDRPLAGSVLSAMSHQATYLGQYRDGTELARAALLGTTRHATATLTAQFHAMEARALAAMGDATGCHQAMSQATRAFEHQDPHADPDWIRYFDHAELSAELGHCFRDLGQTGPAVDHAQRSTSGASNRSDFFATMVLADSHLTHGEVEQACRTATRALELGATLKSARCVTYLQAFRARLEQHPRTRVISEFLDQAHDHRLWQRTT